MTYHSRRISSRKESSITGPKGERFTLHLSCKKSATPASQPLPRALTFSNGLPFKMCPPSFLHFLHKITLLSFVCWAYLGFCHNLFIQNSYSLLFPNKPIFFFPGRITTSSIFKVKGAQIWGCPHETEQHGMVPSLVLKKIHERTDSPSLTLSREDWSVWEVVL